MDGSVSFHAQYVSSIRITYSNGTHYAGGRFAGNRFPGIIFSREYSTTARTVGTGTHNSCTCFIAASPELYVPVR